MVLAGKEYQLADEVLQAVVAAAVPDESLRSLNVDVVDLRSGESAVRASEKAAVLPFLAERRVVVLRGSIDAKKEERDAVTAACAAAFEHAVLVVAHAGKPQRPQGRRPLEEALHFAKAAPRAALIDCVLTAKECVEYIDGHVKDLGVTIDAAARDALASCEDVVEIRNVLDRLALTVADKRIRRADVEEHSVSPEEAELWKLASAVNDDDAPRALDLIEDMANKVGPLIVLANESNTLWQLAGTASQAYARSAGLSPGRLQRAARRFSSEAARYRANMAMRALERSLNGEREADQQLEELIVRLCTMRSSAGRKSRTK